MLSGREIFLFPLPTLVSSAGTLQIRLTKHSLTGEKQTSLLMCASHTQHGSHTLSDESLGGSSASGLAAS